MKAIVFRNYGPAGILQPEKVEKPIPLANELLIKAHASTVTAGLVALKPYKISFEEAAQL